jgi:uncharacterized membrane protein YhaH (DUF805 family)
MSCGQKVLKSSAFCTKCGQRFIHSVTPAYIPPAKYSGIQWYFKVFRQYADFNGRARRKEYWMFWLFHILFSVAIVMIDSLMGISLLTGIYGIVVIIPSLAVTIRRLHDVGKSGWMILIALIPIIGAIWQLVLLITDSDIGDNPYGANPKYE